MQHAVTVDVFQPAERHGHPRLDVGRLEDERLVPDHGFEVGVEELEDQVDVLLDAEDVEELPRGQLEEEDASSRR